MAGPNWWKTWDPYNWTRTPKITRPLDARSMTQEQCLVYLLLQEYWKTNPKGESRNFYVELEKLYPLEGVNFPCVIDELHELGFIQKKLKNTNRSKRSVIPSRLRVEVLNRDQSTCQLCGAKAPSVAIHIDHIVPISKGGDTVLENLQCLCAQCNIGKSNVLELHVNANSGTAL